MEKGIADEATPVAGAIAGIARRILGSSVATDDVVRRVAAVGIVNSKLSVIENVECLGAQLEAGGLACAEMLEQGHVKIQTAGIVKEIAAGVAEGEPFGGRKLIGIAEQRAESESSI